jgi:NADPH:quinone reductase
VLVQAGAGGVGHVSVQLARLTGARVAATVSPGVKADLASSLGAELCIGYRHEDVGAKVRGWTGMDGAGDPRAGRAPSKPVRSSAKAVLVME